MDVVNVLPVNTSGHCEKPVHVCVYVCSCMLADDAWFPVSCCWTRHQSINVRKFHFRPETTNPQPQGACVCVMLLEKSASEDYLSGR